MNNPLTPPTAVIEVQINQHEASSIRMLGELEQKKAELKLLKEQLSDSLSESEDYVDQKAVFSEATRNLKAVRQDAIQQLELQPLVDKIDSAKEFIKDLSSNLGTQLELFSQATGRNTITSPDGENYQIIKKVSVKRKAE